jgi:Zn finger protein HypA/HybF involved in hydrogenase expression
MEKQYQVWCQGCNQWYESEFPNSECPFCYTINYSGDNYE